MEILKEIREELGPHNGGAFILIFSGRKPSDQDRRETHRYDDAAERLSFLEYLDILRESQERGNP